MRIQVSIQHWRSVLTANNPGMIFRNGFISGLIALLALCHCTTLHAGDSGFIRIGTGGPGGTYYPIGGLIALAVSDKDARIVCGDAGCTNVGVSAVHQASNGSISNAEDIEKGELEAGLVQSDVAQWAYTGTGVSTGKPAATKLRAVARLYSESLHLVVRKEANIRSVSDLKNKRVSLDEPGSGTLVDATILLNAYGLQEKDMQVEYIKPSIAKEKLLADELDAFFIVSGYPVSTIAELADANKINLVPIVGQEKDSLLERMKFFAADTIPSNTYNNISETPTLGVSALLVISADVDEETVYNITRSLWNKNAQKIFTSGHSRGRDITIDKAAEGVSVPFHPGALSFYHEAGLQFQSDD